MLSARSSGFHLLRKTTTTALRLTLTPCFLRSSSGTFLLLGSSWNTKGTCDDNKSCPIPERAFIHPYTVAPLRKVTDTNVAVNSCEVDGILDGIFCGSIPLPHFRTVTTTLPSLSLFEVESLSRVNPLGNHQEMNRLSLPTSEHLFNESIYAMNRNARRPKKANKGARPCSRASRRSKKEKIGKRKR